MRVNSINFNNNKYNKQQPAFKSVGIFSAATKSADRVNSLTHLFITVENDSDPWLVKDGLTYDPCNSLGISYIAEDLSQMAANLHKTDDKKSFVTAVKLKLMDLRKQTGVFWDILDEKVLNEIDSIVHEGQVIPTGKDSFAVAKSSEAINFLTGKF